MRNQEYEYTHRRSMRSICWNLCTDFINVDKFGAVLAILDKENSKIFRGSMPPHPPSKRSRRGSSCLGRSLSHNGENVLISDFHMLASMGLESLKPANNNNNSLYLNTVKTDGSCTADVAVYYNTKQYSTIQ